MRRLGKTGIKVSAISLGFMDVIDQDLLNGLVKTAYDAGVNFFDNAEFYKQGQVEVVFGKAFKALNVPRENVVISTKVFWGGKGPNRVGLSRKHIIEGLNASLKRLQLDYVDIVFCHRADTETPLVETCRAFDWLIRKGKAFYWGTSEWPARRIQEAIGICRELGLHEPVVEQPEYSMLKRDKVEKDYAEIYDTYGLGTTIFSPLCGGILTGKYNKEIPTDSRYKTVWYAYAYDQYLNEANIEKTRQKLVKIEEVAKELGCSMSQLALAWTIRNNDVSTAIIGSSKVSQLEENLKALNFVDKITSEVEKKIEDILQTRPPTDFDPKTFGQTKGRRELSTA